MNDVVRQVGFIVFGSVVTAGVGSAVRYLGSIDENVHKLAISSAITLEKITDHERRIGWLEKKLDNGG